MRRIAGLVIAFALPILAGAQQKISYEEALLTQSVRPDFSNPWFTTDPSNAALEPVATTFFGGLVCGAIAVPPLAPLSCAPSDGTHYLVRASYGQPFATSIPTSTAPGCPPAQNCDFIGEARLRAAGLLYYTAGNDVADDDPASFVYARSKAAFRYKDLLYSNVGGSPVNRIEARLSDMEDFYGAAERDRSLTAERLLRDALKYAPANRQLRNALLDLYYDRAVAEQALAKEKLVDVARQRLNPPPPGGFVISNEIAAYKAALGDALVPGGYRYALRGYFELLRDPVGVATAQVDPMANPATPFGYYLFQQEVPSRSLFGANYLLNGVPTPVLNNGGQPIAAGWKDLALLFDILASYGDATAELARLHGLRAQGTDIQDALTLITEAQQKLYLEGTLLLSAFDPDALPGAGDASGLAEKIATWRHQMRKLQLIRDFINGGSNLLGYSADFLMLVQKFQPGGTGGDIFDSYDALRNWMLAPSTGPLTYALQKNAQALAAYDTYLGQRDQLATQFSDRANIYNDRLFKIVGATRGAPGYSTPENNVGSEIWLQLRSIEAARLRIVANDVRMKNLVEQIEIEIERRGQESGVQNAISQVIIDYGDKQVRLTQQIGLVKAAQAAANAAAQVAGSRNLLEAFIHSGNAKAQFAFEVAASQLEARKERLNAEERARINDLNNTILDINSRALIKTWWLQTRTIEVETLEAQLLITQELGRLTALYNERDEIERRMDRENVQLADRYFADPIHLLRMQSEMIEAADSFQVAQNWVFYAARALEYKWNIPFVHTPPGSSITWSTSSVFRVRNAAELQAMVAAMDSFNALLDGTLVKDDYFDWFSVREDFFGYELTCSGENPPFNYCNYNDPITGEPIPFNPSNPPAMVAFRRHLQQLMDKDGNIILDFSTVREIPGGTFFRGPRFSSSGTLISKGLYLDKIKWIKVALPGSHTTTGTQLAGQLTYGGTSFLRTQGVGTIPNPQRPDLVTGEMKAYSTRYWYYDGTIDAWQSNEGLSLPVSMQKSANSQVPPTVAEINGFRERSVAATGWRLIVPTFDINVQVLEINQLNDVELYFYHYAVARP
ncbi:MAG: hypothetical protein AB7E72_01575 [Lysobacterales bacterium]